MLGEAADLVPLVEDELGGGVDLGELGGTGLVDPPPEVLVALDPGGESGLGEAEFRNLHVAKVVRGCDSGEEGGRA